MGRASIRITPVLSFNESHQPDGSGDTSSILFAVFIRPSRSYKDSLLFTSRDGLSRTRTCFHILRYLYTFARSLEYMKYGLSP